MKMIKGFHAAFTDGFRVVDFSNIQEAPQFATVVIDNVLKRELMEEMTRSWTWLSASLKETTSSEEFTKCFPDESQMKENAEEAVTTIIEVEMATEDVYVFLDSKANSTVSKKLANFFFKKKCRVAVEKSVASSYSRTVCWFAGSPTQKTQTALSRRISMNLISTQSKSSKSVNDRQGILFKNRKLKTNCIKAILDSQEKMKTRIGYDQNVLESGESLMKQCSEKFKSAEERNHC
ncbi:hypothetical protein CRE_21514 [Caenorhabditis remanei]|uniref:Uncharacterized protein n=1 Tax=Caenorhabditis remanei TaxID=31234 RepID=E3N8Z0_CAERE|nr:hypothetical protein CRE_21514 [Caenorhabditis remanei]